MDPHISYDETLGYGTYAGDQMKALVKGLVPAFDPAVDLVINHLETATTGMRTALGKVGGFEGKTFTAAEGDGDPVEGARNVIRKLVRYAESQPNGEAIAKSLLGSKTLTDIGKCRPVKLLGAVDDAIAGLDANKTKLAEYQQRHDELTNARGALDTLVKAVKKSRVQRRSITPEVQTAYAEWIKVYGAAKLQCEMVLRLAGRLDIMPEVFDDLAEIHRVPGVSDGEDEPAEAQNAAPAKAPTGASGNGASTTPAEPAKPAAPSGADGTGAGTTPAEPQKG